MNKYNLKDKIPIILILIVTTIIYVWKLWQEGLSNIYYSAAVYSMGQNFHAFFYNSIDSVGFISIDKPPLGLWIQVLFTKLFGFNGMAILLPEAMAGIFSVYLIYKIIDKRFSRVSAIASALVLAFTPILVVVCRNNTIDGTLIFMLVLASWQAIVAAEKSSLKHLIFASIFIALGFNIKSLQACMIVPSVYLTYLIFSDQKVIKKLTNCFISVCILFAISFSWILIVDLTPKENRPYVGSSDTNSQLNLTFGNNGMGRLFGKDNKVVNTVKNSNPDNNQPRPPRDDNDNAHQNLNKPPINNTISQNTPPVSSAGKVSGQESGETSLFRLYKLNNAGQISWFLFPALLTSLVFIWLIITKQLRSNKKYISLFYFSICFIPMFIYFSFSDGVVHRYYLAMLAFPIATLVGIGLFFIQKDKKLNRLLLSILFFITAIFQLYIQALYIGWLDWILPLSMTLFFLIFIILVVNIKFKINKTLASLLLTVLLFLPALWSLTPIMYGNNAQLPIAGPELVKQGDTFDIHPDLSKLITYLNSNRDNATYLAMAPSAVGIGAELILQSGEPVMVLGGFIGGDNPLTLDEFKQLISDGQIKYAVITDSGDKNKSNILSWIVENCFKINEDFKGVTLYQLNVQK